MKHWPFVSWRSARRVSQLAFLVLFFWLFRITEGAGEGHISRFVGAWFMFDPLVALVTMISSRSFIGPVFFSVVMVIATVFLGRFFCGWLCPLGTLLDGFAAIIRPVAHRTRRWLHLTSYRLRAIKYALLIVVVIGSLFGLTLTGFVDPFALLFRGVTLAADPAMAKGTDAAFGYMYHHELPGTAVSEPVYGFLRDHALPFGRASFATAGLSALLLGAIFLMELADRRFWCKNLCPLGAMYGWLGRWSVVRRLPVKVCGHCGRCATDCRMGAFDGEGKFSPESCNLCMDCVADCPDGIAGFGTKRVKARPAGLQPGRRVFIGAVAGGIMLPALTKLSASAKPQAAGERKVLRPPGARDEAEFLSRCTRCGECMKVCPTHGLQPAVLETGWVGMFAPMLVPRTGYCEYNCHLCSQVCPTEAIAELTLEVKKKVRIGIAEIDRERCLPWATNEACIVCEEMCPVSDKAIRLETVMVEVNGEKVELQRPFVCEESCIGCGICENHCPLEGEAAVRVSTRTKPKRGQGRGRGGGGDGEGRGYRGGRE
ncbi:MAG: 4Fe-4S binding protein [Phycisphaeraceae bacterium]